MKLWAPGHGVPEVLAGSPPSASLCWVVGARPGCFWGEREQGWGELRESPPTPPPQTGGSCLARGPTRCTLWVLKGPDRRSRVPSSQRAGLRGRSCVMYAPTRAEPEASRSSTKSKENLSVSRVLRSQDPGTPGQASPCSASQTPGPPSLRTQRHPMGSPRWDNHPNANRPTHRAGNGACLLSVPQARLCSLGFFPLH